MEYFKVMFHLCEDDDSDDDEYRDEYLKLPEKLNSSKNVELLKQLALVSWMYSSKHQNSLQKIALSDTATLTFLQTLVV